MFVMMNLDIMEKKIYILCDMKKYDVDKKEWP
jgi:hypothetical protein